MPFVRKYFENILNFNRLRLRIVIQCRSCTHQHNFRSIKLYDLIKHLIPNTWVMRTVFLSLLSLISHPHNCITLTCDILIFFYLRNSFQISPPTCFLCTSGTTFPPSGYSGLKPSSHYFSQRLLVAPWFQDNLKLQRSHNRNMLNVNKKRIFQWMEISKNSRAGNRQYICFATQWSFL